MLGYFTINAKTLENGIPEDTVSQILAMDGLSGRYTLRSYTYAAYFDADGNGLTINTEGAAQVPEGYENAGRVAANSNSQEDSYFTDGGFEMVEGSPITTETVSQVLIHEKFAQRNGLSVGDTMLLGNVEDKSQTIPVTVAGIFTNTEEQDSIGMAPSYDLYDNIVFTRPLHRLFPALRHRGNHQCPVRGFLCKRPGRAGAHDDRCAGTGWRGLGELHPDPATTTTIKTPRNPWRVCRTSSLSPSRWYR